MNDEAKAIADDIKPTSSEADLKRARIRLDNFASQKDFPVDRKTLVENLRTLDAAQARRFGASGQLRNLQQAFFGACERFDVVEAAKVLTDAKTDLDTANQAELKRLRDHLKQFGENYAKSKIKTFVDKHRWDDAKTELDRITSSSPVIGILDDGVGNVVSRLKQEYSKLILHPKRRYFYEEVRKDRTLHACGSFLKNKEFQIDDRVKAAVEKYNAYLEELKIRQEVYAHRREDLLGHHSHGRESLRRSFRIPSRSIAARRGQEIPSSTECPLRGEGAHPGSGLFRDAAPDDPGCSGDPRLRPLR